VKTPKKARTNGILSSEANVPSSEIRRSTRGAVSKSYIEASSDEESSVGDANEDEEMASALDGQSGNKEDDEASDARVEPSPEPEEEPEEEDEAPPTHSSPSKTRGSAKSTPAKKATPAKKTPTPAKRAAKQINGKATPAAKEKSKVNGAAAKAAATPGATRASKRGKAPVDEYDMPDSD
jgi:hypothetical protein